MLCGVVKHRPGCVCQDLKTIYGSRIYKCVRPGCQSYWVGFNTKSQRDGHTQTHSRPFKCQYSECPFAHLGFAKKTDLESHSAQFHNESLHVVSEGTLGRTNASSEEDLKAILIDAVQENDLSMIRAEAVAVRNFILDLLSNACEGRSSDAMVNHLLGEVRPIVMDLVHDPDYIKIWHKSFCALIEHGNYDLAQRLCEVSPRITYRGPQTQKVIGRTRCADFIKTVLSLMIPGDIWSSVQFRPLFVEIIPPAPDIQAEILALECLEKLQSLLSKHSKHLLIDLGRRCCSVAIAQLLLDNGADIDSGSGGLRPLSSAAKKTSREAAKFVEFLVKNGARTIIYGQEQSVDEFPGPRNIQKWIGITWEELVKQNSSSVEASRSGTRRDRNWMDLVS